MKRQIVTAEKKFGGVAGAVCLLVSFSLVSAWPVA